MSSPTADDRSNVSLGHATRLQELQTWSANRPDTDNKEELLSWATSGYSQIADIARRFHSTDGVGDQLVGILEKYLWEGSHHSATGSWGYDRNEEAKVLEELLTCRALSARNEGSIRTQLAVIKSRSIEGSLEARKEVEGHFSRAVTLLTQAELDVLACQTLRQQALFYERLFRGPHFADEKASFLEAASRAIDLSIHCADCGRNRPDPIRGNDHIWHRYGSRATAAAIKMLALKSQSHAKGPQEVKAQLEAIVYQFEEAEHCFAGDPRVGCDKPGADFNEGLLMLAEHQKGDDRAQTMILLRVEQRCAAEILKQERIHGGSPRQYNTGLAYLNLARAERGLGRPADQYGQSAAMAARLFGDKHPDLKKEAEELLDFSLTDSRP